jgi:hypothetical protein
VKIEISNAELADKVSILSIKLTKIASAEKLENIRKEYDLLYPSLLAAGISEKTPEYAELQQVNLELWEIEDHIRLKEARREFDEEFIRLARSVYLKNDRRAAIKRRINFNTGSMLIEEKQYVDYR